MKYRNITTLPKRALVCVGRIGEASMIAGVFLSMSAFAQPVPPLINYQGRLTDATGNPLTAGAGYAIEFRLWNDPTATGNANLIWGETQQHITVQTNGAFNILLGTGTLLPNTLQSSLANAFTTPNVYLGTTVTASNGFTGFSPNEISPRQQLLTVPFAFSAASASTAAIATSVAPGSISSTALASNAVQAANIAPGSVSATSLGANPITAANLPPRPTGASVGVGGLAMSSSSGTFSTKSLTLVFVTNLSVTIITSGRPVYVGLIPDGVSSAYLDGAPPSGDVGGFYTGIVRNDGGTIYTIAQTLQTCYETTKEAPGQFHTIDTPSAGTHIYSFQISAYNGYNTANVVNVRLIAYEL